MKKAFEDYKEMVINPQFKWIKRHWKGWTCIFIIAYLLPIFVIYKNYFVDPGKEKFSKEGEEND